MKRSLIHVLAIAIAGTALVATGHAQTSGKRPPPKAATPQNSSVAPRPFDEPSARLHIGERAPDFELEGSNGRHVRLASLRGDCARMVPHWAVPDRVAARPVSPSSIHGVTVPYGSARLLDAMSEYGD